MSYRTTTRRWDAEISPRSAARGAGASAVKVSHRGMRWEGKGEAAAGSGGGETYSEMASSWKWMQRSASSPQPCTRARAWRTCSAGAA
uniref:Uncharacterized protein n=1 Tax=Arundo donax TaxID=35708 RepID=A0A0A9CP96_ARUDO